MQLSLRDVDRGVAFATLVRLRRASTCFGVLCAAAALAAGIYQHVMFESKWYGVPVNDGWIALLWGLKIVETAAVVASLYGVLLIARAPDGGAGRDHGRCLRRMLAAGLVLPALALAVVPISWMLPVAWIVVALYTYAYSAWLFILAIPTVMLGYLAIMHRRSKKWRTARFCFGAAALLTLVNGSALLHGLSEQYFYGIMPNTTVWPLSRLSSGVPLVFLSMYQWSCFSGVWFWLPIVAYAFAAAALLRTSQVMGRQIARRSAPAGEEVA